MVKVAFGLGVFRNDGSLTRHAKIRMQQRSLTASAVDSALQFGRLIRIRGAEVFALGQREIRTAAKYGLNLTAHDGVQVVCTGSGVILTAYRNRNFRRLRPRRRRRR